MGLVAIVVTAPLWSTVALCDGWFDLRVRSEQDCNYDSPPLQVFPIRSQVIEDFSESADCSGIGWLAVPCDGSALVIRSGYSFRSWYGFKYRFGREHEAILVRRGDRNVEIIPFAFELGQRTVEIVIPQPDGD